MAGRKEYELLFKLQASLGSNYASAFKAAQSEMARLQGSLIQTQKAQANVQSYKKMDSAISVNRKKLSELKLEHERLAKEIKVTEAPSKNLTREFKNSEKQIIKTSNEIEKQEYSLRRLKSELVKAGVNTDNLDLSNIKLAKSYERIKKEQAELAQYQMTQEKIVKITEAQEKNNIAIAKSKNSMLMTTGAVTALGTAIYKGPVKSAMELESQMADVSKVVDWINKNGTAEQIALYKDLKQSVLDVTTQIPMTAEEITAIMESAGQSNVANDNSGLVSFTKDAAKMGIAFDTTSAQAGEWMAKWRTSFKMSQADVVALSDKINYLGNTSAANARQISDVVTKIGPLGDVAGVASGEIAALGTAMISTGVQEDVAATGIKNFIIALNGGSSATKSQIAVLDKLKLSSTELAKSMQIDAKGAILEVLYAVKKLPEAEQTAALTKYFGKESVAAIAPLLTNLDYLKEQFEKVGNASQYAGSMEAEYAARADTRKNKIVLTVNKIKKSMITAGEALLPLVDTVAESIGDFAEKLADFAEKNPQVITNLVELSAKLLALKLGGDAAKVGFLSVKNGVSAAQKAMKLFNASTITTGGKVIKSVGGMATATGVLKSTLSALTGPVGWIIGGIGAITTGVILYRHQQEKLRQETLEFSKDLTKSADAYQEISDKSDSTKALTEEYRKLVLKTKDVAASADEAAAAKERMEAIEDALIEQNPDVISKYDKENGKILENLDLLDKKANKEQEMARRNLEQKQGEASEKLPDALKESISLSSEAAKLDAEYDVKNNLKNHMIALDMEWKAFDFSKLSADEQEVKQKEFIKRAEELGKLNKNIETGEAGSNFEFKARQYGSDYYSENDLFQIALKKVKDDVDTLISDSAKSQEELDTVTKSVQDYYNTSVQLVETNLGGSLKSVAENIEKKKTELARLNDSGHGNSDKANALNAEIASRESDLVKAAAEIRDYGLQVKAAPDAKTIDITDVLKDYQDIIPRVDAIPESNATKLIVKETNTQLENLPSTMLDITASVRGLQTEIETKHVELSALNNIGQGNSDRAAALKIEIDNLESKCKTAIEIMENLGVKIEEMPEVKAVEIDKAVENIDAFIKKIEEIPTEKTTKVVVDIGSQTYSPYAAYAPPDPDKQRYMAGFLSPKRSSKSIAAHAYGGIITKPTLSTFAERCPEAAIPLDGSARSRALWEYTGRVQGFKLEQAQMKFARENATIYANMPSNEVTAPVVEDSYNSTSQVIIKSSPVFNVGKNSDISEVEQVLNQHDDELLNKLLTVLQNREHDERRNRYD